jgi:hypothetical protein
MANFLFIKTNDKFTLVQLAAQPRAARWKRYWAIRRNGVRKMPYRYDNIAIYFAILLTRGNWTGINRKATFKICPMLLVFLMQNKMLDS